jgi:hypothetical protein
MPSVDALPSTQSTAIESSRAIQVGSRTVHDKFHIVYKTMNNFKGLGCGRPRLFKGEAVEPL